MKNPKFITVALLMGTSVILVGCHQYENKPITKIETSKDESTTLESVTTKVEETTTVVQETTTTEIPTEKETSASVEPTTEMTDEEVIEYIRKISDDMTESSENIFDSVKSGFITVVDFLFYEGTIGGRTFDSLTDEAKSKVLGIYDEISTYVEEKWPTWKESLEEKYQNVKELWNEKKEDLSDLWQSGKQKVKEWYEKFRNEN